MGAEGQAALRERPGADLLLLEDFDVQEARLGLAGDMGKTAHAAYALELCDRLCPPRHAEPAVFDWLQEFLHRQGGPALNVSGCSNLGCSTGWASARRLTAVRYVVVVISAKQIRAGTLSKAACCVRLAPSEATS